MERLLSEGANLNWATEGAAYAASRNAKTTGKSSFDQIALMENLILRGGSFQWCLNGAARGRYQSLVDDIINRTKLKKEDIKPALLTIHPDLVEHLIERSLQLGQDVKKVKLYTLVGAALKGNQNSVEQLLNQVDLKSMDVVAAAAAHGGHYDLMKNLNHQVHKDTVIPALARGNHKKLLLKFYGHTHLTQIIGGAAAGSNKKFINEFIRSCDDLMLSTALACSADAGDQKLFEHLAARRKNRYLVSVSSARFMQRKGHLDNKALALRMLTFFKEPVRSEIAKKGSELKNVDFSLTDLIPIAAAIETLCQERKITYDQALAWQTPEIQGFFAFCVSYNDLLPKDINFLITLYLSPHFFNNKSSEDLFEKMPFEIRKTNLTIDLRSYHNSTSRIFFLRDGRPLKFEKTFQQTKTDEQLDHAIEQEIRTFTKKDDYQEILEKQLGKRITLS